MTRMDHVFKAYDIRGTVPDQLDAAMCRAIGQYGVSLIRRNCGVLTHCNAGYLATAGNGTALAILYEAHRRGIADDGLAGRAGAVEQVAERDRAGGR